MRYVGFRLGTARWVMAVVERHIMFCSGVASSVKFSYGSYGGLGLVELRRVELCYVKAVEFSLGKFCHGQSSLVWVRQLG